MIASQSDEVRVIESRIFAIGFRYSQDRASLRFRP